MNPGQRLTTLDGTEVMLFPINCMYITQGEGGSFSHTLAMDFVGWSNTTGQIYRYPYYAPCTLICVDRNDREAWLVFESIRPVRCADGVVRYITLCVMHDNSPLYNIGDIVYQGEILGHTGTKGYVTGDHVHINVANGKYQGWTTGQTFNELRNSTHIYYICYINDTTLYQPYDYAWQFYTEPTPPPPPPPPIKKGSAKKWLQGLNKKIILRY